MSKCSVERFCLTKVWEKAETELTEIEVYSVLLEEIRQIRNTWGRKRIIDVNLDFELPGKAFPNVRSSTSSHIEVRR